MAITKEHQLSILGQSLRFPNAYIKLTGLVGDKNQITIHVQTNSKKDDGEILDNKTYSFIPNLEGKNFISQGYDYLKTLPEFADAADC